METCADFIHFINTTSRLTGRALGSRDSLSQRDFKKGRGQCFILSNMRLNTYTFNKHIGLPQTHDPHFFLISPWTGAGLGRGTRLSPQQKKKKTRTESLWDPNRPKALQGIGIKMGTLFSLSVNSVSQVPGPIIVLFDYSFALCFSKLGPALHAFVLSSLGALLQLPRILVCISQGSLHS